MRRDAGGHNLWLDLSFGDLEEWVGSTYLSRGRDYQKKKRVLLLACSPEGELSAQVVGSDLYDTVVERDAAGNLSSVCSCPLGGDCKHAVAVVLEYLDRVKAGKEVPSELPASSAKQPAPLPVDPTDDDDARVTLEVPAKKPRSTGASRKARQVSLDEYLHGLPGPELVSLVLELADAMRCVGHRQAEALSDRGEDPEKEAVTDGEPYFRCCASRSRSTASEGIRP